MRMTSPSWIDSDIRQLTRHLTAHSPLSFTDYRITQMDLILTCDWVEAPDNLFDRVKALNRKLTKIKLVQRINQIAE